MKKLLYFMLLCALLPLIVISCAKAPQNTLVPVHQLDSDNISQSLSSEIKIAYFNSDYNLAQSVNEIWLEYLGIYNGCEVCLINNTMQTTPEDAFCTVEIAKYKIRIPRYRLLSAYKDGNFYTLEEAYNNGFITESDVYKIGIRLSLISAERAYPIFVDFVELKNLLHPSASDVGATSEFEDLGRFTDCTLMYVPRVSFAYDVEFEFNIAGYEFTSPDARILCAYKDGRFYTLEEAYENGFITKSDVYKIASLVDISFEETYPTPKTK